MLKPKALNEYLELTNKKFPEINNILYKLTTIYIL